MGLVISPTYNTLGYYLGLQLPLESQTICYPKHYNPNIVTNHFYILWNFSAMRISPIESPKHFLADESPFHGHSRSYAPIYGPKITSPVDASPQRLVFFFEKTPIGIVGWETTFTVFFFNGGNEKRGGAWIYIYRWWLWNIFLLGGDLNI